MQGPVPNLCFVPTAIWIGLLKTRINIHYAIELCFVDIYYINRYIYITHKMVLSKTNFFTVNAMTY